VYLNNGDGSFVDSGQLLGERAHNVTLSDINLDGNIDVVVQGSYSFIYMNDGNGVYELYQSVPQFITNQVSLGDINGDQYPDLVQSRGDRYEGGARIFLNTHPFNAPPNVEAGGPYSGNEGSVINIVGTAIDAEENVLTDLWSYTPDVDVDDGAYCIFGDQTALETTITCTDDGTFNLMLSVGDGINNPVQSITTLTVHNVYPNVTINQPIQETLYQVGSVVDLSASYIDTGTNDSHFCSIDWENGELPAEVDKNINKCKGIYTFDEAGVYTIKVIVTDDDGDSGTDEVTIIVQDPDGGFVTAGGWIESLEGTYVPDPSVIGKATFGFVSKYNKKTKLPEGNIQITFNAGDLHFHSNGYDWLVVNSNDSRVQLKGTGTINGEGEYKFMLWAVDGEPDTFRIKIWEDVNGGEQVIYDNKVDGFDEFGQPLGGGSIVFHAKK